MLVEPMKYVSITGHMDNLNWVIEHYIAQYDIQLEYAARKLSYVDGLQAFTGPNPYVEALHKAERFAKILESVPDAHYPLSGERAVKLIEDAHQLFEKRDSTLKALEEKRDQIVAYINTLRNFTSLQFDLLKLALFTHIGYSFGRLPVGNYEQFEAFMYDDPEILFVQSHSDHEYIWGVYFTPMVSKDQVDSIFSSLHFERMPVSATLMDESRSGTPSAIMAFWQGRLIDINLKIDALTANAMDMITDNKEELAAACKKVKELYFIFDTKKYAAKTETYFYVFVGWMSKKDALALESEIDQDELTVFSRFGESPGEHGDANPENDDTPPTKLRNPPIIRLFEFFVGMYGLPMYGEIDPTPVMAIIYTLLFGLMFGDVGQGLCIALLGYYAYRRFKTDLGGIMCVLGVSATVFGFLYGSVFGFEHMIPALWRRPAEDITGTLLFAVGVGVGIIFVSMLMNILNAIRQRRWSKLFFSPNGLAGMFFYGIVLMLAVSVLMNGHQLSGADIALACLPLVFVAFREPITRLMEGRGKIIEGGVGMFIFGTIIELYEVVLTYLSNTISFVRVGAFALSHAGMMSVVMLLSESASGSVNPAVILFGNVLVIGIEGLLVGIQVLRLNFYEVFSRFYEGGGQRFVSYRYSEER